MSNPSEKYCTCLHYSANALSRIMTRLSDEKFAKTGLSSSLAFLLISVNDKQGIQPKELSAQMMLTPSTVTRLLEKMEYRGFIYRKSNGRNTEVYSTKAGLNMQPLLKSCWNSLYKTYTSVLGRENAAQLTEAIYHSTLKLNENTNI